MVDKIIVQVINSYRDRVVTAQEEAQYRLKLTQHFGDVSSARKAHDDHYRKYHQSFTSEWYRVTQAIEAEIHLSSDRLPDEVHSYSVRFENDLDR